jgi:hypothetical protein
MSNATHTQPAERDRVHPQWTPEATALRNGIAPDCTMLRWGVVSLAEKLARVRSEHCGAFPVQVLPEDVGLALTGYGVTVTVKPNLEP